MRKNLNLIALGGLVSTTVVSGLVLSSPMTRAANSSSTTTAKVTVSSVCSMTATVTSEHTANLVAGTYSGTNYPNGIGETSIETFCNDQDGYAIYAVGYTNNVLGNNKLVGTGLGSSADIITGTATGPNGNNDISNWAMKVTAGAGADAPSILNGFGSFSAVPSSYTKVASLGHVTTSSTLKTTYAAYISATQPAGTYTGQVKYVLVNPNTAAAPNYMQEVDSAKLAQLMPSDGSTAILTDSRDGNKYQVTNIDGTYWMTDNLRFTGTNLTPADTNVAQNTIMTYFDLKGSTYDESLNNYTSAGMHYDATDENSSTYGAYYNYCAASAGTVCNTTHQDTTSDICPKGWRLPTYTEITTIVTIMRNNNGANFNPVLAGDYLGGRIYTGSYGTWWSATTGTIYSYYLYYGHTFADDPLYWGIRENNKYQGNSIRCVRSL